MTTATTPMATQDILLPFAILLIVSLFASHRYRPAWWSSNSEKRPEQLSTPVESAQEKEPEENAKIVEKTPSPETTPKAKPVPDINVSIPSFTLSTGDSEDEDEGNLPPPTFPAANSAQRVSKAPVFPPLNSAQRVSTAPLFPPLNSAQRVSAAPMFPALNSPQRVSTAPSPNMPPPPRPNIMQAPLRDPGVAMPPLPRPAPRGIQANSAAALRIPSTGPLPNRGPAPNRNIPSSNQLAMPMTNAMSTPNPRKKVALKPGHSPLDWANLQKSGQNLSGVDKLLRVTPSELKGKNGRKGNEAWSSYLGKVYNITPFLNFHPGGRGDILRVAGKDGEQLFMETHPWVNWDNMIGELLVGILVGENDAVKNTPLDEMD